MIICGYLVLWIIHRKSKLCVSFRFTDSTFIDEYILINKYALDVFALSKSFYLTKDAFLKIYALVEQRKMTRVKLIVK